MGDRGSRRTSQTALALRQPVPIGWVWFRDFKVDRTAHVRVYYNGSAKCLEYICRGGRKKKTQLGFGGVTGFAFV